MDDLSKLETRIRDLEAQRAKGKNVPELDGLYSKMDNLNRKAYDNASKYVTGEMPDKAEKPEKTVIKKAKGGTASSRGDGCACRGKTRGRIV